MALARPLARAGALLAYAYLSAVTKLVIRTSAEARQAPSGAARVATSAHDQNCRAVRKGSPSATVPSPSTVVAGCLRPKPGEYQPSGGSSSPVASLQRPWSGSRSVAVAL